MKINEIYLGNCVELMPKHIEDKSIDLIFCDLPYGTTQNKWDSIIPLGELWKEYKRVVKNNGVIVLFGAEPFSSVLRCSNLKMYKYDWVWEKPQGTGFLNSKKRPLVSYENISVFYNKQPLYNPQMTEGKPYLFNHNTESSSEQTYGKYHTTKRQSDGKRYPKSVLRFNNKTPHNQGLHKTQKPIELIEYIIKTYTNEGDLILDNTCGSGTTGLGAKNLYRNYIMMEQDLKYYDIACKRVQG